MTWSVRADSAGVAADSLRRASVPGLVLPAVRGWCCVWPRPAEDLLESLSRAHPGGVVRFEQWKEWVRVDAVRGGVRATLGGDRHGAGAFLAAVSDWGWADPRDAAAALGRPVAHTEWRDVLGLTHPAVGEEVLSHGSLALPGAVVVGLELVVEPADEPPPQPRRSSVGRVLRRER